MSEILIERASRFAGRIALATSDHQYTYADLLASSAAIAGALLGAFGGVANRRVALLSRGNPSYVFGQWGIWRAGGMVLPLCPEHPAAEMAFLLEDSEATVLLAQRHFAPRVEELVRQRAIRVLWLDDAMNAAAAASLPRVSPSDPALMLYTSGTTRRPKGVITTHANIAAQITALTEAWEWSSADRILNFLPLHHIHGVINVVGCALWSGATCEMQERFELEGVLGRVLSGDLTLFMAVPTIYSRLIDAWNAADAGMRERLSRAFAKMRLMVSGSAALPVSVLQKWQQISGHTLLERYGMTETGMILSNPLRGQRIAGAVGTPLPGVEVRVVDDSGCDVAGDGDEPGEILVRGPAVFSGYWNRPEANAESFVDGWFRTGDIATRANGVYRILGRKSVDIIKTGGYKVSAIEIEETLREHPDVAQVAVVGVPDEEWGQRVAAAIILQPGRAMTLPDLRRWAKERMSVYKAPSLLKVVEALPRNAMGKVVKPQLVTMFQAG